MTILLLPIAFVAWPILVAFVGSLFGIFYGLFCPTIRTFDSEYDIILYMEELSMFLQMYFIILEDFGTIITIHILAIYLKWKKGK